MKIRVIAYVQQETDDETTKPIIMERLRQEANADTYGDKGILATFDDDDQLVLYEGEWEEIISKKIYTTVITIRSDFDMSNLSLGHLSVDIAGGHAFEIKRTNKVYDGNGECPGCNHPECPNFLGKN